MLYETIRPLLFSLDPETAHEFSLASLHVLGRVLPAGKPVESDPVQLMGLTFPNRIGLAAGLDKNGEAIDGLARFGFGFIEIGTVTLGAGAVPMDHVEALHDLGHLPLRIKALPEGTRVPMQVPTHTIENTDPRFAWLTNFIETMMSAVVWGPCTSATLANRYRRVFEQYAQRTGAPRDFGDHLRPDVTTAPLDDAVGHALTPVPAPQARVVPLPAA